MTRLPADEAAEGAAPEEAVAASEEQWLDDGSLPLDGGALPFYFLDAHEEPATPDTVYLFGKARHATSRTCLMV